MSEKRTQLQERYELKEVLGRGGMGVVYKAYDSLMRRDVALKTILDIDNTTTMALFYKEWSVLATMVHPNVISIYDIGEFDVDGTKKPFFVMPLLPGGTLEQLIKDGSPRLSVTGVIDIIDQACRGLHAAHEQGLVHRDVKPSNIFVMDDNSVKIIDFGVAREMSGQSRTTLKGTLSYMSPEQLELKPPTPVSDLFSLAVVTFEALTRRRPFQGSTESEVAEAIRTYSPPPVSEINHEVSYAVSQVVHKAMAKQPWHRFPNMREYGEALQKALRGEPLEYFDSAKIKPRLERAAKGFAEGEYAFASDVLSELEAEGHMDQEIHLLRGQVDQAMRQTRIRQMLESARRFFEAGEYPLALRKIQEALELDPGDSSALALKNQVEKERRERKISEWITLARQHIDNQAFRQAREALDNVLQVKPNETDALGLIAELARREQEVSHTREEKSRLYQAAVQAWEKGEVTSAMSKLENLVALEKDSPEADTGRSGTYHNFYNQVHSEHNAIKNAYDEARGNLADENFEAALAICKQYLIKYPNHALFQSLKFDIEERQRQKLSSVIAGTDRRAEEEPDLDRRVAILQDALKAYPGEPHFDRALRLVRDKRDLVNSIVAKAGFFEERGQFNEALDQWQILKSIHEKHPGLAFEIQRLGKRRDQQAHENAKARWVEQTDKHLERGDYDRAGQTVESALAEFAGDPELLELEKLVQKNRDRGRQALEFLEKAHEARERGAQDESLEALRQANALDPRSTVIRTVFVNSLLDQARRTVDNDWVAADATLHEVLAVEPNHAPAQSLMSRINDRKREDFVSGCLTNARRLQTEGDIQGALTIASQAITTYPNESRLQQLHATLQRAQAEEQRLSGKTAHSAAGTSAVGQPISHGSHPAPPVAPDSTPDLTETVVLSSATPPPAAATPTAAASGSSHDFDETRLMDDSIATPAAAPPITATPPPASAAPPPPVAPQQPQTPPSVPRPSSPILQNRMVQGGLAAAAVLIIVIIAVAVMRPSRKAAVTPAIQGRMHVSVHSTPSGAVIKLNGIECGGAANCDVNLPPGSYQAEASLPGYEPLSTTFNVVSGTPADINLALQPSPPRVTISTDLTEGTVQLDGQPAGQIQDSGVEVAGIKTGTHQLAIQSGSAKANFTLELTPGALPKINGPIDATGLRGFVVAQYGGEAHVYGNMQGFRVSLDGKEAGTLDANGLDFKDLSTGTHELRLAGPAGQQDRITFDAQPSAAVYASLRTNRNVGELRVAANEDDAEVYINGEKYKRKTTHGRLLIYLSPKQYTVRVQKDGFAPVEQTVDMKTGEETTADFKLLPAKAILSIRHAPPGSDVLVDGTRVGKTGADGSFTVANLDPGKHSISVRHDDFKPLTSDELLASGKTLEVEAALEGLTGTVNIEISPAGVAAKLRVRRDGEAQDREVAGTSLTLPEGSYTITGSAPRYQDATASVRVTARRTVSASLTFKPAEGSAGAAGGQGGTFSLTDWQKTPGWTLEGGVLVHRGGDFVLTPMDITQGKIQFSLLSLKGKRLEWVIGYRDPKNYYLFQVDDKNFIRSEVVNGKRTELAKVPHASDRKKYIGISITITPKAITHSIARDQQWQVIDNWESTETLARGKFGFNVPGKDEIALGDFKLTQ
ncbi:MAG TPA: PEGA domain-containing protein [Bryobacteraceae bacterium]|nr:PEGA domain-containing protein [Bryobacteraceae bacterium]